MEDPNVVAHTVECPECGKPWTGQFRAPLPDKAVCRDCIRQDWRLGENHPHVQRQDLPEFRQKK